MLGNPLRALHSGICFLVVNRDLTERGPGIVVCSWSHDSTRMLPSLPVVAPVETLKPQPCENCAPRLVRKLQKRRKKTMTHSVRELAKKLPESCATVDRVTGGTIIIRFGEAGFHNSPTVDAEQYNQDRGITPAQVSAMECGSMFGWEVPGADPDKYYRPPIETGVAGNPALSWERAGGRILPLRWNDECIRGGTQNH